MSDAICKGSLRLKSGCGDCSRCAEEAYQLQLDGHVVVRSTVTQKWTYVGLPAEGPIEVTLNPPVELDLFDKIRLAREGAAVERCHTHPHLQRYSVGHHSLDLVTLLTIAWQHDHHGQLPRAELLVAAAFHDVPERIVGDVPQPVKALNGGALDAHEDCVLSALRVNIQLTEEERVWLAVGDKVELYLWCFEEAARGNSYFLEWVHDYNNYFMVNPPPSAFIRIMRDAEHNNGGRLRFNLLKQVAQL